MDTDPQYRTDDGSALRIWTDTAQNNYLTQREGRPVFDEVIYVEVISPGSRGSTPVFEVLRKFAPEMDHAPMRGLQYDQFEKYIADFIKAEHADATMSGTPLREWPEISRTMAAQLRAANVYTVDALANLPDSSLMLVGPDGRTWREKARAFLSASKDSAYATQLAAELQRMRDDSERKDGEIKALAAQIAILQNQQSPAGAEPPPKPSTPPSATDVAMGRAAPADMPVGEAPQALGDDLIPAGELKAII